MSERQKAVRKDSSYCGTVITHTRKGNKAKGEAVSQDRITARRLANESHENVRKLQYQGKTLTNSDFMHEEEAETRLNSGTACYYSVQNLSPSLFAI